MKSKINDKIKEIEEYLSEVSKWIPEELEDYKKDPKTKSACERQSEKIIEAAVDLTFIIIKDKNLNMPEDDTKAFDILVKENIIPEDLAIKLKEAKGMRNILAHEYGKVDDEIVFHSIKEELNSDIKKFIKYVKKLR